MKKKLADKIKEQQPKTNSLSEFDKLPVIKASEKKVDIVSFLKLADLSRRQALLVLDLFLTMRCFCTVYWLCVSL